MNKMHSTDQPDHHSLGRGAGFALSLLALCLGLLLLPRPVAAQTPITPDNPCLASQELTSLTVPGTGDRSLRGIANQPVVSRDGTHVAFWSTNDLISGQNRDGNIEIFFRSLAAQQPNQLTDSVGSILGGFNLNPSINAAGDRVAFFSDRPLNTRNLGRRNTDGNFEIFLAVRTGNSWAIDQITDTQLGANLFPSISGDGARIAFVSDEADLHNIDGSRSNPDRTFQIFLATIGGNGAATFRQITQTGPGVINDAPVISADGRRIAFTQSVGDTSHIYLWDAANPNTTVRLTEANSNDQPAINADGSRIAYVSTTPAGRSRIVLYIAGTAQQGDRSEVIVPQSGTRQFRSPSISDNGLRVAYVAETATSAGPQVDVYLFDATVHSQGGVPITTGATEQPHISGDGAHVVYVGLATEISGTDDVGSQIRSTDCPLADLALTPVNAVPATVLAGIDLVYTFRLTNHGPSTAGNARVEVEDIARPSQVTLSAELSDEGCTLTTGGMTCTLGDLAPGASVDFTVGWSVPENSALNDIRSRLRAFSNAIDPNPARADSGVLVTRVTEVANLVLTKTGSSGTIQAGGTSNFIYELRLQNTGPSRARESVLIDNLPNNVVIAPGAQPASFITQGHDPNASCALTQNNRVVRCELGNVPAGTVTIVRIPVRATAAAVGQVINQARVESETEDLTPATRQTSLTTQVFAPADMQITKTVDTGAQGQVVIAGNHITYTLTVRNLGTAHAGNVMVDGLLPANVTFVEGTSGCTGTGANQGISCALGTMNTGTQRVLTIVGRVAPSAPAGTINNSFRVQSNRVDPDLGNNESAPVDITVIRRADVELVSKTTPVNTLPPGGANTVRAGETLRYNIVVRNNGPSTAVNARMVDTLPAGVEFVGASAGCSHPSGVGAIGGTVTCQAGTLNPNATASFFIDVRRTVAGNILNTAAANSDTQDDVPGNNSKNLTVMVRAAPTTQLAYTQFPQTSVQYINNNATLANTVVAGEISSNIQLVRRDQFGNINNWEPALNVTLTDDPAGGLRSAFLNTDEIAISTISIPQTGTVTYRYRDERAGTVTLRAAAGGGITAAQRDLTVIAATATKLVIISPPYTGANAVTAGVISGAIVVQRQDQFNNPNWYEPAVTVDLDVVAGPLGLRNENFYHATQNTTITQVTISPTATNLPAGSRASFRYYDERAGTKTIHVDDQGEELASGSQQITIVPGPTRQITFTNDPRTIVAGTSGPDQGPNTILTIQRLDEFDNPNTSDGNLPISLETSAPDTGEFTTVGGTLLNPAQVTIQQSANPPIASFRYRDTRAGVKTLTASAGIVVNTIPETIVASQPITIVAGPAVTLELQFEPAEQTITAGELSDLITVTRYDSLENPADQDPALDVELDSSSAGDFRFFDGNQVELPSQQPTIVIPNMQASATFYYSDTLAATHHITGTGGGLQAATGTITVTAAPAHQLAFITAERTITAGQRSEMITIQQQDRFANPADQEESPLEIQLAESSNSLSVQFLDEDENPLDLPIVLQAGETYTTFLYYNELAGTYHITATAPPLIFASQAITITPDRAQKLIYLTPTEPITAGVSSNPITVQRQDQFNNPNTADPDVTLTLTTSVPISYTFLGDDGETVLNSDNQITIFEDSSTASFHYHTEYVGPGTHIITTTGTLPQTVDAFVAQAYTVVAADAAYLQIRGSTDTFAAGVPQPLTITAFDEFHNVATGYTNTHPLTFGGAPISPNENYSPTVTNAGGAPIDFGLSTTIDFVAGESQVAGNANGQMTLVHASSYVITATDGDIEAVGANGFAVTVQPGALAQYQVQTAPGPGGALLGDETLRSGVDTLTVYAASSDQYGNGRNDPVVVEEWQTVPPGSNVLTFDPIDDNPTEVTAVISGTAQILPVITDSPLTVPSGLITVVPGPAYSLSVERQAVSVTPELVIGEVISSGVALEVFAVTRDWAGNYIEDSTPVDWEVDLTDSVTVNEDQTVRNDRDASFVFAQTGTTVITASIGISESLVLTPTGVITVVPGAPAGLVITAFQNDTEVSLVNLEAGEPVKLHIVVYDAAGNIATDVNNRRDVTFFGSQPSPAPFNQSSTVTRCSGPQSGCGGTQVFGLPTRLDFDRGVLNTSDASQGLMTLYNVGDDQVITATIAPQPPSSDPIQTDENGALTANVTPAPVSNFGVERQGGGPIETQTAGEEFNIQITARDPYGNITPGFSSPTTLTTNSIFASTVVTNNITGFVDGILSSHPVTLVQAGENRSITATAGAVTGVSNLFEVQRRPITITAVATGKVYGESDPALTYNVTGGSVMPDLPLAGTPGRAPGEQVGTYPIQIGTLGTANPDYDIDFVSADFEITPASLTITAEDKSKVYGEDDPPLTVIYSGFQLTDDETVVDNLTITRESGEDVGTYEITPSNATAANYTILHETGTFTISLASLTVTAHNQNKVYDGLPFDYNDFTVAYAGFENDDSAEDLDGILVFSGDATTETAAGSYTITPDGLTSDNYDIDFVNGTLTISPRVLELEASETGYITGTSGIVILDSADISDVPANPVTNATLTVTLIEHETPGDQLFITDTNTITSTGGNIFYNSQSIGNYTYNASTYELTMNISTVREGIVDLLLSVAFSSTETTSLNLWDRVATFQMEDDAGGVSVPVDVPVIVNVVDDGETRAATIPVEESPPATREPAPVSEPPAPPAAEEEADNRLFLPIVVR